MKKLILIFALAISTLSYGQKKFYVVNAEIVQSTISPYTHVSGDSVIVDSTKFTINCWFGQEGNPYVQSVPPYNFCAFAQITRTVNGADATKYMNKAKKLAEIYRKQIYPNVP